MRRNNRRHVRNLARSHGLLVVGPVEFSRGLEYTLEVCGPFDPPVGFVTVTSQTWDRANASPHVSESQPSMIANELVAGVLSNCGTRDHLRLALD